MRATVADEPWSHPDSGRLRLVRIAESVLHALARGEDPTSEPPLTPYLRGPDCAALWRMRSAQLTRAPGDAPWVTRFVVVPDEPAPIGLAGFHGPPDEAGTVEVGYRIDPAHRRRGHARQALETLLAVARAHPDVRTVRATVSPDNHASQSLILAYGFTKVGQQWDADDGLGLIFDAPAIHPAETEKPGTV